MSDWLVLRLQESRSYLFRAARRVPQIAKAGGYRLLAVLGHEDYVPFVVLTRSRTGSNLLLSFLNSHPNVYVEGEIFARLAGKPHQQRLGRAFGKQPRHVKAKGFKIFYYHPLDSNCESLWTDLQSLSRLRVIHLVRENMLRTLLSRKIAETRGIWTGTRYDRSIDAGRKAVVLETEELKLGFLQTQEWVHSANERFSYHPKLTISYEQLLSDPSQTFRRVLEFLDLHYVTPKTKLEKQNPEKLSELIINYQELKADFSGTAWAHYFED